MRVACSDSISLAQLGQIADARLRRFAVLLVRKVERFGRLLRHLVNALSNLDAYGVAFVSLRDNLDPSTLSGWLIFRVVGAVSASILTAACHMLKNGTLYQDLGANYFDNRTKASPANRQPPPHTRLRHADHTPGDIEVDSFLIRFPKS